jgi:hypothetical protein
MKSLILSLASVIIFSCNNKSTTNNMSKFNQPTKSKTDTKGIKNSWRCEDGRVLLVK